MPLPLSHIVLIFPSFLVFSFPLFHISQTMVAQSELYSLISDSKGPYKRYRTALTEDFLEVSTPLVLRTFGVYRVYTFAVYPVC